MSEYHAAVGLAELDCWPEKRARFLAVAHAYARTAEELGLGDRVLCDGARASCYALFAASDEQEAEAVEAALTRERIDYRLWYGMGIHNQPFYREYPRSSLEVTAAVAPLLIGLPMAVDLGEGDVWHILSVVQSAFGAS